MTKVLIVDDAAANRKVLAALLAHAGYESAAAASADEARRLFAAERPTHVLTDLQMPGEDGISFARSLREMENGRSVRIALTSGDVALADEAGGLYDKILAKPVTIEELRAFIDGEKA